MAMVGQSVGRSIQRLRSFVVVCRGRGRLLRGDVGRSSFVVDVGRRWCGLSWYPQPNTLLSAARVASVVIEHVVQ